MEVKLRYRKLPTPAPVTPQQDWDPHSVWDEFRNGSELAFTAIYKRYVTDLYHYGERLVSNRSLIEDSIHDLFVELWRQRSHYKPVVHLKFYLLKSFKHRLIKNIQRTRRMTTLLADHPHDIEVCLSHDIDWPEDADDHANRVLKSINALSLREKQAVFLRFYDGLTYEEIASLMSISTKSTYKLMYRALEALRKAVGTLPF